MIPRTLRLAAVLLLAVTAFPACADSDSAPADSPDRRLIQRTDWPRDPVWDDGRAEVCVYDVTGPKEGATRAYSATSIVVKEDMDLAQRVKSDKGPVAGRTASVLKMNLFFDIPTGVYSHHLMSSAFYARDGWRLLKLVTSSQDGCGLTFAETLPRDNTLVRRGHSYWDGEADAVDSLVVTPDAVMMDAMPLWLRGMNLFWRGSYKMPVIGSGLTNRLTPLKVEQATIEFLGREALSVPAGNYDDVLHVRVTAGKTQDEFWFDARAPHPLVSMWRADGSRFVLAKYLRLDYWNYAKPGDERLLAR